MVLAIIALYGLVVLWKRAEKVTSMIEQAVLGNEGVFGGYLRAGTMHTGDDVFGERTDFLANDTYTYDEDVEMSESDIRVEFEKENEDAGG